MTRKRKILVVDDEVELIRKPLVRQLNRIFEDFEISEAGNGKEAIEVIAEHHPELVILDLMMPVMNGIDTLHELSNQGLLERTHVVVYTAASDEQIKLQALGMGAIGYLEKTVQLEELEMRIRNFLELQTTEGSQHTIEEPLNDKEAGLSLTEIISNVNSDDVQDEAHVEYDESNQSENTSGKPIGEMSKSIKLLWSDKFLTHFRAIDSDHKGLFEIFGTLYESQKKQKSPGQIENILVLLSNYVEYHFEREEHFMEEASYSAINEHKQQHRLLTRDIQGLRSLYKSSPHVVNLKKVVEFLFDWLQTHILKEDMLYGPELRGETGKRKETQEKKEPSVKISALVPSDKAADIENLIDVVLEHGVTKDLLQMMNEIQNQKLERARSIFS